MRSPGFEGVALAVVALVLSGCGALESAADNPVPTMTVRPSDDTPSPSAIETAPGITMSPSATKDLPSETPTSKATEEPEPTAPASPTSTPTRTSAPAPVTADLGTPPTSYRQAVAYVDEARSQNASEQKLAVFRTPDDIYCVLRSDWLDPACELPQGVGVEDPQACRDAMSDKVGRVQIVARGAEPVCNTDTIRESLPETVAPLGVVSAGGVDCAVAKIGITCVKPGAQVGFFLGLDSYAVFG